jgi:hypothetical protein
MAMLKSKVRTSQTLHTGGLRPHGTHIVGPVVHGFQQLPLDVVGVRQAHLPIQPDRTRDPGRYFVGSWKLVVGPRGVPGFRRRGKCLPVSCFEVCLGVPSPGSA